jgi:transcriptional regulator with XRE-family HTH domain
VRDAAFTEALEELRPELALIRAMREARLRAGLTQAQLAQRMGTTQSAIARLERGPRLPSLKVLRRLAAVTGSGLVVRLDEVAS